jgi:hypothetical protein
MKRFKFLFSTGFPFIQEAGMISLQTWSKELNEQFFYTQNSPPGNNHYLIQISDHSVAGLLCNSMIFMSLCSINEPTAYPGNANNLRPRLH